MQDFKLGIPVLIILKDTTIKVEIRRRNAYLTFVESEWKRLS